MLAHGGNYWLEIKQLPFCFTASRFSATPSPADPQTAQWADFVEQMNNCGLICFWERKKKGPEAIDKQEAEVSVKEE